MNEYFLTGGPPIRGPSPRSGYQPSRSLRAPGRVHPLDLHRPPERHPQPHSDRTALCLALALALLTAVRPSVGVQEDPKIPSVLIIGVDLSETMTVPTRWGARTASTPFTRCSKGAQPLLDELAAEQNVNVVLYQFSAPDFNEAAGKYPSSPPADGKRSDYGTYLNRTFDRWQGERFLRGSC